MAPHQAQKKYSEQDIRPGRLSAEQYGCNFADTHPPLNAHQAAIEAGRCYFCYDAPCISACPTGIDIPSFIGKISTGNVRGSAKTILEENIFGAMCARVCPTEILCEEACVRNTGEHAPVAIGALQRHATDLALNEGIQFFAQGSGTSKKIAVVGAGPAGLSCAHRLAMLGHSVKVFEARDKPGGLNEFGIAAYKVVDGIAAREVEYILAIGGIEIEYDQVLGRDYSLDDLRRDYDSVFLAMGLGDVNRLGLGGNDISGLYDAVDYIAELRQSTDLSALPVGRRVVVIGGGMTAIDIATQSKRLGADDVTIVYRRGEEHMGASLAERDFAQTNGVKIKTWAAPHRLIVEDGKLLAIEFERTELDGQGGAQGTGEKYEIEADTLFRAIGQKLLTSQLDSAEFEDSEIELDAGRIIVDQERKTSLPGVWAGGDCVADGLDLTVSAVQDGKIAAIAIHQYLQGGKDKREPDHG